MGTLSLHWLTAVRICLLWTCLPTKTDGQAGRGSSVHVDEGCSEFFEPDQLSSGWNYTDCVDVWMSWVKVLPPHVFGPFPEREMLAMEAAKLRSWGSPCLVRSGSYTDGVGSSTIRHLASWMFAEEIGCDWVTPSWPKKSVDGQGTVLDCHYTTPGDERVDINHGKGIADPNASRCGLHNWVAYFCFDSHSVSRPTNDSYRIVEAQPNGPTKLEKALTELKWFSYDNRTWDRLLITLGATEASTYFQTVLSWDDFKREKIRGVLKSFRNNFLDFPRPWYDHQPQCAYGSSELDFAIHVRLGDRAKLMAKENDNYFLLLEAFIEVVTDRVLARGYEAPVFHVFSETSLPCPVSGNGTFEEFPQWPLKTDQILRCLEVETPTDCPEKQHGAPSCFANRSGIFRVRDRQLYLHTGLDVENALSCMAKADGLLMGCSTFGHVAGILNKEGISFFSTACTGMLAPLQYKMMPPLAIAERGQLWVPISGSWRNPTLNAMHIFEVALDQLLQNKGIA